MKFAQPIFLLVGLGLMLSLSACSGFRFPGVYKPIIQQGHIITKEMVDQLSIGMSKRQVRFVLGNPLTPHTFNDDRWDYPYSIRKGSDGEMTQYLFTVFFDNEKLAKTQGDYLPDGKNLQNNEKSEKYLDDITRDTSINTPTEESPPKPPEPSSE
jgi:outer membrane protein assembly factor BamE